MTTGHIANRGTPDCAVASPAAAGLRIPPWAELRLLPTCVIDDVERLSGDAGTSKRFTPGLCEPLRAKDCLNPDPRLSSMGLVIALRLSSPITGGPHNAGLYLTSPGGLVYTTSPRIFRRTAAYLKVIADAALPR